MITPQLQSWALSKGYRLVHGNREEMDVVECPMNGYVFSLGNDVDNSKSATAGALFGAVGAAIASSSMRVYTVRTAVDHSTWNNQALKEIKQLLKGIAAPAYAKGVLTLSLKNTSHTETTYQGAEYSMYHAAQILAQKGVRAPGICTYCKAAGCDTYAPPKKGWGYLAPAHKACVENVHQTAAAKLSGNLDNPSFFRGLPWLLLGTLLGLILPAILPILDVFSLINLLFYLLIPVIAFSFYQRHGGRMNALAFLFVLALTGAAVLGVVIWGDYVYINSLYGDVTFAEYSTLLTDAYYLADVLVELFISWVAGFVGVLIGWFSSRSARKRGLQRLEAIRYTQAVPPAAPQPEAAGFPQAPATAGAAEPAAVPASESQFGIGFDE